MVRDLGSNFTSLSGRLSSEKGSSILAPGRGHLMLGYILSWHPEGFNEETKYWIGPGAGRALMACTRKEESLSRALLNRW